ncbi:MAG: hypothetical protein KJ970_10655 [Candidatus Eisenbacteria bacterium]|uniref:Uncharacterized protein n=1 Tax=Eiseniibacteriota bacterium TaxID=2212470 RepID=A0A948W6D3_UNCEI|nr:hypothetical protein [Candidatus Eisenbacteria bacterium]MBU2691374.1 hypothetical protein [Candidatus Eisenbacteria bacterium]
MRLSKESYNRKYLNADGICGRHTVDGRFEVECVQCPADEMSPGGWCEWVFRLAE